MTAIATPLYPIILFSNSQIFKCTWGTKNLIVRPKYRRKTKLSKKPIGNK